jgi:hypothetical protein
MIKNVEEVINLKLVLKFGYHWKKSHENDCCDRDLDTMEKCYRY